MRAVRRATIGVFAALAAAVLAGCAGGPFAHPTPRAPATPVDALGCAESDPGPAPGGVPAGFAPDAAYRCDPMATQDDAQGTWSGTRLTRYEGDLAPLLAALADADEPRWPGACPAIGFVGPLLWLGDADGRYVRVAYPVDGCGMPRTDAVFAALDALTVVDEHFEPGRLIDSSAARREGCPTAAEPLALLGRPAKATPDLPGAGALTLCRYESAPPVSDGPDASASSPSFVGAAELDADAAAALWRLAASADPAPALCGTAASRFVVLVSGAGDDVTVELDGCRRLLDRSHRAFAAPAALLALLEAKPGP